MEKELKAEDVRIGNLLQINNPQYRQNDSGKEILITKIDSENDSISGFCPLNLPFAEVFGQYLKYIKPIPITEEWLIKFGFVNDGTGCFDFPIQSSFSIQFYGNKIGLAYAGELSKEVWITYVHQLQNLYYALTNQELKFNKTEISQ